MGERRIRNLQAISGSTIIGADLREDRRNEVEKKYGIETIKDLRDVPGSIDAVIVSTPPDKHDFGIQFALDHRKPVFVEASVVMGKLAALAASAKKKHVLICPSCTLRFHPAIKLIKQIVQNGRYGSVTNFSYHIGQYLPDWHPWEKLDQSYTSRRETGGAREMVAFDLTWLIDIVGYPDRICGLYGSTLPMGADIDDTYVIALKSGKIFGSLTVDVVARYATRRLVLNMGKGQLLWSWDEPSVRLYDAKTKKWTSLELEKGTSARGYNKNISEDMYVDEMKAFISGVKGTKPFPNTLKDDIKVLQLLHKVERRQV